MPDELPSVLVEGSSPPMLAVLLLGASGASAVPGEATSYTGISARRDAISRRCLDSCSDGRLGDLEGTKRCSILPCEETTPSTASEVPARPASSSSCVDAELPARCGSGTGGGGSSAIARRSACGTVDRIRSVPLRVEYSGAMSPQPAPALGAGVGVASHSARATPTTDVASATTSDASSHCREDIPSLLSRGLAVAADEVGIDAAWGDAFLPSKWSSRTASLRLADGTGLGTSASRLASFCKTTSSSGVRADNHSRFIWIVSIPDPPWSVASPATFSRLRLLAGSGVLISGGVAMLVSV